MDKQSSFKVDPFSINKRSPRNILRNTLKKKINTIQRQKNAKLFERNVQPLTSRNSQNMYKVFERNVQPLSKRKTRKGRK